MDSGITFIEMFTFAILLEFEIAYLRHLSHVQTIFCSGQIGVFSEIEIRLEVITIVSDVMPQLSELIFSISNL